MLSSAGGLSLPCDFPKSNALFLSQACRLLVDPTSKQFGHIKYWLGLHLRDFIPEMSEGAHAKLISVYFKHLRLLLVEGLVLGDIVVNGLARVTAKQLYLSYTSSFPPPQSDV